MIELAAGFLAGAALGAVHFGGLWLSVRRIPGARSPGLVMTGGYFLRLGILGAGLYAVVRFGGGRELVAALTGLLVVRSLMVARIGPRGPSAREGDPDGGGPATSPDTR